MPTEPITSLSVNSADAIDEIDALPGEAEPRYEHWRHAGNQGDLAKHALLLAAVAYIVERNRPQPFIYAESHAGPASHTMEPEGAWTRGVEAFGRRISTVDAADQRWPALHPYVTTAFECPPREGLTYPGSHALVYRFLKNSGLRASLHLWDICPRVCGDLRLRYRQDAGVKIHREDGFQGIVQLPYADLALIDPPSLDPRLVAQAIAGLAVRSGRFLCWVPRTGTREGGEDPVTQGFLELVAEDYFVGTAQWRDWKPGLCGCAIVASTELEEPLSAALTELLWAMGWRP
ncbi:MAG: hypothetical protein Kow006_16360 [Gammaproteobacteria bacterium]